MTDDQAERPDLDRIEALCEAATEGPWELWTGCSWRRIGRKNHQAERPHICPTKASYDGHPDLEISAEDAAFVVESRTLLPAAAAYIRAQDERLAEIAAKARAYQEHPVDANDWPDSWRRLDELVRAALPAEDAEEAKP